MDNALNDQLIERFLLKQLSEEESELFQRKMKDEAFAAMVASRLLSLEETGNVRSQLKTNRQRTKRTRSLRLALLVLISLLVLCGLYFWFSTDIEQSTPESSPEQLLASHYEPHANLFSTKGGPSHLDSISRGAMVLYDQESYYDAVIAFSAIDSVELFENDWLAFYYGISLFETNHTTRSADIFEKIATNDGSEIAHLGHWYYLMSLLKTNKVTDACAWIEKVHRYENVYKKLAYQDIRNSLCE